MLIQQNALYRAVLISSAFQGLHHSTMHGLIGLLLATNTHTHRSMEEKWLWTKILSYTAESPMQPKLALALYILNEK
jgi:hypothetical protein